MVSATTTDRLEILGQGTMEAYLLEIANTNTLETGFGDVVAVFMCPEETQDAATAYGYSVGTGNAAGQVTFSVNGTATYSVLVIGRK